jgi:hypothetical protein
MTNDLTLVQGRPDRRADLFVGITLKTEEEDFAGRFQVILPEKDFQPGEDFKIILRIEDFKLDPSLSAMRQRPSESASGLIVESVWYQALYQAAGLAIASLELTERPP